MALEEVPRQHQHQQEEDTSSRQGGRAAPCLPGSDGWESHSDGESSCSGGAASLSGMRAFVAQLQHRYGLQNGLQGGPSAAAPAAKPLTTAHEKLQQLHTAAAAAAAAAKYTEQTAAYMDERGDASCSDCEERDAAARQGAAARRSGCKSREEHPARVKPSLVRHSSDEVARHAATRCPYWNCCHVCGRKH